MEKQHNRGQDGAGLVNIKIDAEPGKRYISRYRSNHSAPLKEIFAKINSKFIELQQSNPDKLKQPDWLKKNLPFTGEVFLGHLRYGTFGNNGIESCHPFLRINNWQTRNLAVAGNFNLTNVDELFNQLVELGQHPKEKADTVTVMERIGHFLDKDNVIVCNVGDNKTGCLILNLNEDGSFLLNMNYFGYATENSFNNSKAKEDMINGIANIISIVEKRIIISITK